MGTRRFVVSLFGMPRDHPHAYGDKTATLSKGGKIQGSSPRVWGQVASYLTHFFGRGIIPTRMGTRYSRSAQVKSSEDHPHAYGDKSDMLLVRHSL